MFHGVLDPQPGNLVFALFDGGKKIFENSLAMRGRDAAALPGFVQEKLAEVNLKLTDIQRWTVGSGPGSFTFLRLVASVCAGWKYGHDEVHFRCIPGALALVAALDLPEGSCGGAIYDGRNKEVLFYGVKKVDGSYESTGESLVLNAEQAAAFFAERANLKCAVFASEAEAVSKILPSNADCKAVTADVTALAGSRERDFDDQLNLVYIRPATH